ncbi:Gfo/Idh/MocA family oxidoreductase [Streptosporangium sp. NPDC023615]|uniref:Gfo/Idh/MocA family protein n=1 Tax=Streptosporangium sp. NPDC023615 TaxID=3154794 RepID=UPI0034211C6B
MEPVRVVLAGAHGHGSSHLRNVRRLAEAGLVELAGVCDVRPVDDLPAGTAFSDDLTGLIERTGAEVTILCTPIHTHADLAERAMRAGTHLLLEKPPAATYADYLRIAETARRTGLACQVGFQSLGSEAIPAVRRMIAEGAIGRVVGIGAAGAWERPYSYYDRVPWAGRREVDGVPVVDGALTNPLAHATATALAVSGARVEDVEVELYRANAIESDDTSCVRLRMDDRTTVTVAVSLCADRRHEPYLIVHGERGRIRLTYTEDRVESGGTSIVHPRTGLLENLVAHLRDGAELLVPLERTAGFMRVLEAVRLAPPPLAIPDVFQEVGADRRVLPRIAEVTAASAERLALYSELRVPWTRPFPGTEGTAGDLPATVADPYGHTMSGDTTRRGEEQ